MIISISLLFSFAPHMQAQTDKKILSEKIRKATEASENAITFIENKGQWPGHVLYRADIPGGQMLATPEGMLIGKYDPQSISAISKYDAQVEEIQKGLSPEKIAAKLGPAPKLKGHGWRFNFVGGSLANPQSMTRSGESKDYFNYLIGDASTYATNVHGYSELVYKNVYHGVDVRYYTASNGDLENDIIVYPGGDVKQLKLHIDGIDALKINSEGELVLPTSIGEITVPSPVSYLKDEQGIIAKIDVKYEMNSGNIISFKIPEYDKSKTLVIDPIVMRWACWISGNTGGVDAHNHGIDVDAAGNIYATGRYGNNMITVGAFQTSNAGSNDVFISKYIEPVVPGGTGQRVWQTYMGTSSSDNPYAMNIGLDGNLYIVGVTSGNYNKTYGTGYPTASWTQRTCSGSIGQQCWIAKVSPAGTWAVVREIGSASADFSPTLWDLRVIPTGASTFDMAVVGSVTQSSNSTDGDIPAAITPAGTAKTGTGDLNGYVFRISSDLNTIVWARQYTSSGNNNDQYNIASVDAAGDIYMSGYTAGASGISYNNPSGQTARVGSQDGWMMKVAGATGNALWSRYFNASAGNNMSILCMEFNRAKTNLILGGITSGAATYNITTATAYAGGTSDFIIASVPVTGAATNWGTYYGGSLQEYNMMGLNVDQNDDIYVLGYTYSKNIATVDYPLENSSYNSNTGDRQAIFFKLAGTNGANVLYSTYMGGSGDDYDPLGERGIKFSNCRIYLCMTAASADFPLTAGTLTSTKTSSGSTLDPLLVSMSNPPDLQGNSITGGGTQTITCGQIPAQITAGVPTYIIPTIIRNNTNQTNGTVGAFPNGVPPINNYQWQISVDTGYTWTNIPGATAQNYTPSNLNVTGLVKFRRIINGDACNRSGDTLAVVNITVNPTSPAPTISNNGPLCAGLTLQLTANTVAGASYSWTGPNGFTSTLQNPTITNVTTAATGAYKCIVIATANSCPSYPSTTNVVVTGTPAAPTAGSNSPICAGQTLNLSASGLGGATFSWTGPNSFVSAVANPSISNVTSLNAGTYFATQSISGCASPATAVAVVINTIPAPTGISASPNPICSGQNLTLSATATSGATLNWTFPDGGGTSGSPVVRNAVTTAMGGTYSVTQTLSGCVSGSATVAVTVYETPSAPMATASPVSVCTGSNLTLNATGVSGAVFNWTYPDGGGASGSSVTRNSVTSVMAGTYSVTQTVNGCVSTVPGTVAVTVNPLPIVSAGSTASKYCSTGTLSLTSSVSAGTLPYTYSWTGPSSFVSALPSPSRTSATPAMSGVYNLLITDGKGCQATAATPYITVNQSPSVTASSSNPSYCTGGTINLFSTPSVGPAPYTYSWSGPGGFTSVVQNPSITNVTSGAGGVYTVVLTDSNGCTATASTISIVVFSSPSVTVSSSTATYCSGATISLTSNVTGGTPSFGYSWSGPSLYTSSQPDPTIPNSTAAMSGVYTLIVTDNHSCTATASTASLVVYTSPIASASSSSNAYCEGTTIVLNSSASSGTSPYTYSWSGPLSFSSNQQNTTRPAATTGMSGIYSIVVTDANHCTATASTNTITINPGFTVSATSNSPVCAGGTLNLYSSSAGGTSPFVYSWSATSYTSALQNPSRSGANAAMAGSYSLTVTDKNGCSGTNATVVVVNPATNITVTSNSQVCAGDTLTLLASPSSGTGPFTYIWSGPSSFSASIANPSRSNADLTDGGTYFVTATDANGCSGTGSTSVVVNPLPAVVAGSTSIGYCVSSTISLNATPSLGTAPYVTYNWSGPSSYSSNQQNPTILNASTSMAGNYSVLLTDSKGCSAQSSVSVTIYTNPIVSAGVNQTSCSGENVLLGGNPTASGGNPSYTYLWNNGAANTPNPTVTPLTSTTYTVTVIDSKLCSTTASSTVTVNAKPIANAGLDQTIPSCSLIGTSIGGTPTATGGASPYTYLWAPAAGLSSSGTPNPTVKGIGATTTYTVTVTDHNSCTASAMVTVNVTGSSLALNISANGTKAWCASGASAVTLTANPSGGSTPYTYSWTGANLSANNAVSTVANPSIAGSYLYSVIITDATGCQAGDTTSILVYPKPSANAGAANYNICLGDTVTIGGNPTASGGTGPFTYAWSNGTASVSDPLVSPVSNATYNVTVTDANSCTASASSTVTVRSNPVANAGADVNLPSCSPTGIQIGGNPTASGGAGSYTYQWSPADALTSTAVSNPVVKLINSDKTYTVTVTDGNGCSASAQINIHVINNTPSVNISAGSNTAWCAGSGGNVNLTANVTGGTLPLSYSWSGSSLSPLNSQTATADPNTPNTYTYFVTVTDGFNCTAIASKAVTVNSNPTANAGSPNYTICNGKSVAIGGNPTGADGTQPYTYAWSGGASPSSNPVVSPASTSTYVVTVFDANNCTATASTTVTVRTNPTADAGLDKTMPGCTPTGLQIGGSPTGAGGGGSYSYTWSPSAGLSSVSAANPAVTGISSDATYTVVVMDVNGCTASDQMNMHIISNSPSVNITASGNTAWCAGSNSSVNLTANVTGGTNPLSYSWSGVNINPINSQVSTVYPNSASVFTYVVTVTDGYNCTATASKSINVNANPIVSAGASIHDICAGTTIAIGGNPTASGGTTPYTYAWNSGANAVADPSVTPLTSTTYIVTVTDSVGCSATASTTVLVRPTVHADAGPDKTVSACRNACVTIGSSPTGFGGAGALTYAWSPSAGLSSTTIANPIACGLSGTSFYTVTVTDTAGCTATDQVMITATPSSLTAEAGTGGAFCTGSGDSVMLGGYPTAVGGVPAYTYTWSPAGLNLRNPANPVAYPIASTTYYLTITDALGCTATDSSIVRVFPAMTAQAGRDTAVCAGSPVILGGSPTASGGSGSGYTYVWSPATDISNITLSNPIASPFTSIDYAVTATDGNGCKATDHMIITVRPNPVAQAGPDKSITACPLDSVVIGDNPAATGGTLPYIFSWSPATGLSSTSVPNPIVTGIGSTQTYILTLTDSFGCKGADNVIVRLVPSTLQAFQPNVQQVCSGPNACVQLGGLPTAIGGTSPYAYTWSGTATLSNPGSSNPIACPLASTVYTLTITDSKGCVVTTSESVIIKPSPVANAGSDTAICSGKSLTLGGSPTASGGTGSVYTYSWLPATGINNAQIANPISNATATTTYTVSVTDSLGCSASANMVLSVRSVPVVDAGPDKSISVCSNDTIFIGNIPVVRSGGTAPYSYQWSPSLGLSSATVSNPLVFGISQTASYQIIVTDTFGCTGTDNVIVNVNQQTLQAQAGNANVICAAAGTPVSIGGLPSATGGTPPYVYSWTPAAGLSNASAPNPIATVSSTTMYYLTVRDAKGCVSVDSVKITQNPAPIANAGADTALCSGFGKILGGNPTASGGTGTYHYSWTPTLGLNANNTSNPSAYPLTTTIYQVLVTDSNGCQASSAVTITIHQNPTADAGASVSMTSCIGDSIQIGGTPSASNGAGGYTYAWSPSTGLSSDSAANPYVKGLSSSLLYALTVTDANGCSAASAMIVSVVRSNLSADAGNDVNICAGAHTIVTLGGVPIPTGGLAPYTYTWAPAQSLNSTTVSNPFATPAVTTKYTVTVTDARGCAAIDSVIVNVNPSPVVNAGSDTTVCFGNPVVLGGKPTASGSQSPYVYSWSPSIGMSSISASNPTLTPIASSAYAVSVSDANGCTATASVIVGVNPNPTADAGPDKTLFGCSTDSVMIGGTPSASGGSSPYTYLWSPVAGTSSATAANPFVSHLGSSVTYTLVVTDKYGCSASDQMLVNTTNSSLFAEAGNNVTVCEGATSNITLGGFPTATGGIPSYTYVWSPAAGLSSTTVANPAASPTQTTLYTVVVSDGSGCIAIDSVYFTVNPKPAVNAGPNDTICQRACVVLGGSPTADGNDGVYTYSWLPTQNLNDPTLANPTACPTSTITYTVTATNQLGCSNSASVTVKVNANPVADAGPDQTIVRCSNSCITLGGSLAGSGGLPPYTYAWSPNVAINSNSSSNPTLCDLKMPTTYTLIVTDANGCTTSDAVTIQTTASNLTADAGPDKSICAGQSNCITIGGSPSIMGGTPPYIVNWSPISYFCNSNTIPNPNVNPVEPTVYKILVQDAKGCIAFDSMRVIANPAVTAVVNPDTSVCAGSAGVLGGFPSTGSGGTPPYSYSWSPTVGMLSPGASNPTVTPFVTTTYCVTVTDAVGCSTSTCQAVNVSVPLIVDAGPDKTITGCRSSVIMLGGTPVATGGSGNYAYSWTPTVGLDSAQSPNPQVQGISTSTVYTLVVTDRLTGCSSSDQVRVSVIPSSLSVQTGPDQVLCYNNHTGVQIGGIPTASGGQTPYTYNWSPGQGLSSTNTGNPIALPSVSTTYYLSVSDALGCLVVDSVRVSVVPPVRVSIVGLNPTYCINSGNIVLNGSPAGGTFSGSGVTGNIFQPASVGVGNWCITYTYTNPNTGCIGDTVVCIKVDSLPTLTISGYSRSYCHLDNPVTLTATPAGGTFSGAGMNGNVFTPANASSGDNTITYTYGDTLSGCSNSMQIVINIKDVPTMTIAASETSACPGSNVSLSATYSVDVFNILWTDINGNSIYSGLNPATVSPSAANNCYIATAINTPGCVTRDTICIQLLNCNIKAEDEPCTMDSMVMNSTITVRVLDNDTIPAGSDTTITIRTTMLYGTANVNSDHTITYAPQKDFSGNVDFVYQVCVTIKGYTVCDTANVCITVIDTTIKCHFPNTITPNNDGVNDNFEISCNDSYPGANIRIYSRWGAEVFRSFGHYDNKWDGHNQQGTQLPDGTYFYMYYFNDGTGRMKKGFIDVYR